jgi:hypothetical protein
MVRTRLVLTFLLLLSFGACALVFQAHAAPAPAQPFNDRLLEIAKTYVEFGRIDNDLRWAPIACDAPRTPKPGVAHFSQSADKDTHGRKLYSLFVKDARSYLTLTEQQEIAVGQVLVKESWVPEEVVDPQQKKEVIIHKADKDDPKAQKDDHFFPYAEKDGRTYHAAKRSELFIMYKMDPKTPDTDAGWVYGTVTPDGKKVTSAGKIESCMKCHQKAAHDRLFGMPGEGEAP